MTRRWQVHSMMLKGYYERSSINIKLKIYTFFTSLEISQAYGEAHGQAYDIVEYTINMPVLHILSDITEHDIDVLGLPATFGILK